MGTECSTSRFKQRWKVFLLEEAPAHRQTKRDWLWFQTHFLNNIDKMVWFWSITGVMPESVEKTCIQPESYVIIDDIRIMGLKHGNQRECLYKFFTMYTHHYKLNVFFLSQSFDNMMDMKINTRFLYRFRFTGKTNIKRYIDTLVGGKCIKSNLIYRLYEKLLDNCERPVLAIDCSRNQYFTYCNGTSQAVHFE